MLELSRTEFPFIPEHRAKDPMPRMASGSPYCCMSTVRIEQPRTRLGPSPVAWAPWPVTLWLGVPGPVADPSLGHTFPGSCPGAASISSRVGGSAEHPMGHLGFTVAGQRRQGDSLDWAVTSAGLSTQWAHVPG